MSKLKNISKKGKNKYQIHQEIVAQKYSSLLYMSSKRIRKEAKIVKSFECQKIVRKIKELKSSSDHDVAEKLKTLEETLKNTKAFDLERVVQSCTSRCGLIQKEVVADDGDSNQETSTPNEGNEDNDAFTIQLMNDIIKHKRIVAVMQDVRVKVSEYNTWLAKEEEWLSGKKRNEKKVSEKSGKSLKRNRNDYESAENDIFVGSLAKNDELSGYGDADKEEGGDEDEGFADYENYEDLQMTKKNRMGQRQRKARAKAIEAAKKGRVLGKDQSLNWRPRKQKRDDDSQKNKSKVESASGLDISKNVQVGEVANMGKNWKDEGKAHPSWAAREAQKTKSGLGIVEFKGKKITFD